MTTAHRFPDGRLTPHGFRLQGRLGWWRDRFQRRYGYPLPLDDVELLDRLAAVAPVKGPGKARLFLRGLAGAPLKASHHD